MNMNECWCRIWSSTFIPSTPLPGAPWPLDSPWVPVAPRPALPAPARPSKRQAPCVATAPAECAARHNAESPAAAGPSLWKFDSATPEGKGTDFCGLPWLPWLKNRLLEKCCFSMKRFQLQEQPCSLLFSWKQDSHRRNTEILDEVGSSHGQWPFLFVEYKNSHYINPFRLNSTHHQPPWF